MAKRKYKISFTDSIFGNYLCEVLELKCTGKGMRVWGNSSAALEYSWAAMAYAWAAPEQSRAIPEYARTAPKQL